MGLEAVMTVGVILVGIPFFEAVFNACGEYSIQWEDGAIEGKLFDIKDNKIKLATVAGPVSHLLFREHYECVWAMVWHVCSQATFSIKKRTIMGI